MSHRLIDPSKYGFTEEQWAALDEDHRLHFRKRSWYERNRERELARAAEHRRKQRERATDKSHR